MKNPNDTMTDTTTVSMNAITTASLPILDAIFTAVDGTAVEAILIHHRGAALQAELKTAIADWALVKTTGEENEKKLSAQLLDNHDLKETHAADMQTMKDQALSYHQSEMAKQQTFYEGRESLLIAQAQGNGGGGSGGDGKNPFLDITVVPFDGQSSSKLDTFVSNMDMKILAAPRYLQDEQSKLKYYLAHLQGKARDQVSSYANRITGHIDLPDVAALKKILYAAFGEADEKGVAQGKVHHLKQGNRALAEFLPEWQHAASLSGFDNEALIYALRIALHPVIQRRLALSADLVTNWIQYLELARAADVIEKRLDPNYYKDTTNNGKNGKKNNNASLPAPILEPHLHNDPMDTSKLDISKIDISKCGWTEADIKSGRRPKTPEEKLSKKIFCMATGRCVWCYDTGHIGTKCPEAIWNQDQPWYTGNAKKQGNGKA